MMNSFMKRRKGRAMNREPVCVRASSLGELFDCPARWEARHLRNMCLPASAAAMLGTAVHAGTALYDQSVLDGNSLTPDEAAGAVVDTIYHPAIDVDWEDMPQKEAEKIAVPLHKMYCEKIAPMQNYRAVETTCENLTIEDIGITLTGTVDRIRNTENGPGISDLKTGRAAVSADGTVKTQGHALQIGVYELLAQAALGEPVTAPAQIIGLQTAKTDKGRRVGIGEMEMAREILLDDENGKPGFLTMASKIIRSGDFFGNPRSQLCNEKYCPAFRTCKWRK